MRTLSLRIALVVTVVVAAELGTDELAATQIWFALYSLLALALDALAIAGQALIGHDLGAGNVPRVHAITRRLVGWGVGVGVALMVPLLAATPLLTIAMTSDDGVRALIPLAVVTLAVGLPLAGLVFVLDGVLIGAGDGRYLAVTGILNLIAYLAVLAIAIGMLSTGLAGLFLSFMIGYLAARAATLGWRARGTRWIVTGASHKTGGE